MGCFSRVTFFNKKGKVASLVSPLSYSAGNRNISHPWEFIQIGNCGSPLETDKGWIVLTHGVGPMRQYFIGTMLLDLENPARAPALKSRYLHRVRKSARGMSQMLFIPAARFSTIATWSFPMACLMLGAA